MVEFSRIKDRLSEAKSQEKELQSELEEVRTKKEDALSDYERFTVDRISEVAEDVSDGYFIKVNERQGGRQPDTSYAWTLSQNDVVATNVSNMAESVEEGEKFNRQWLSEVGSRYDGSKEELLDTLVSRADEMEAGNYGNVPEVEVDYSMG